MEQRAVRIGTLAKTAGISPDSIRHYERLGLLPPAQRTPAGYRMFSAAASERLLLIRSALRAGFSLRQLQSFLRERQAGGIPCRKVRDTAAHILARLGEQIQELQASRDSLRIMLCDWDDRLARTGPNQPAHLLTSLATSGRINAAPPRGLKRAP
jgi:MerR family copper efflux transcriptional regulator